MTPTARPFAGALGSHDRPAPKPSVGAAAAAVAALALSAAAAAAHTQVRPGEAAPLDPTLWTVLVPNEREQATTRIELQVPKGVVPFSFEDTSGWRRTLTYAPDKSIAKIVWRGRLTAQGLALFTFLATTPDREGRLAWKALQTYADGQVVSWIGAPAPSTPATPAGCPAASAPSSSSWTT
jgi:uncharacterized protein YcnI